MARWTCVPALFLVATLLLAAPSFAACTNLTDGIVAAPTLTATPPPYTPLLEGVTVSTVPVLPGQPYWLEARGEVTCVGTKGVCLPDFNIAFYGDDDLISYHSAQGDQSGVVPSGADRGVVWMRYGPDLATDDGSVFATFRFSQGC